MQAVINAFKDYDYSRLMDWSTLVEPKPPIVWNFAYWYIGLSAFCLLIAIVIPLIKRIHPEWRTAAMVYGWTYAILGLFLFFFRSQRIPYLGMDILRSIQLLSMLIWGIVILFRNMPLISRQNLDQLVQSRKEKYLPKPKQ